jgi:hypothetical protein
MAAIGGTAQTYQLNGLREDLTDMIWNLAPTETPFVTRVGRTSAEAVYHEWQTDTLDTPADNAQIEGDDTTTFQTVTPTVRLGNYTQILKKTIIVSGTADVVNKAGRKRELAYQIIKRGKEIRMDVEYMCVGRNGAKVAGNSSTARHAASVLSWLTTNTSHVGSDPTGDGTDARVDGTPRAFTETLLKDVLELIYINSGEAPSLMMVGANNKQVASTFTGNATRQVDARPQKLYAAIDAYSYDFGMIDIQPNRIMRSRDALILNPSLWKLSWLRPIVTEDLAKTGDAEKRQMIGEVTLEARNEKGSGGVFDLT